MTHRPATRKTSARRCDGPVVLAAAVTLQHALVRDRLGPSTRVSTTSDSWEWTQRQLCPRKGRSETELFEEMKTVARARDSDEGSWRASHCLGGTVNSSLAR